MWEVDVDGDLIVGFELVDGIDGDVGLVVEEVGEGVCEGLEWGGGV